MQHRNGDKMAGKKKGLGKGLDALITDEFVDEKNEKFDNVSRETFININKIEPNQFQPRCKFEEDALQELADSIKVHGVIQPLVVQKKGEMYEIIAGERRWRASRLAGLKEVPVVVKEYSDNEVFEIALIENIQREDLNPIEEALAYQKLIQEYKLKQDEVAERVAKSRVAVTNSLRLLKLSSKVQQMIIDEMISGGHARALLGIDDPEQQYIIANRVFDEKLSVRETERLIKKLGKEGGEKKKTQENGDIYRDYENKIRDIIGSKVEIQCKANNKGKIIIDYYSGEEFERIYDFLAGKRES